MSQVSWGTLLPLIIASAVVPVPIALTILLQRSSVATAASWVGGMTVARLAQGALFALVLAGGGEQSAAERGVFVSAVLLVLALLLLTKAVKGLLGGRDRDEDALPPRWMRLTGSVKPPAAFLLGAGYIAIAAKLWVFTLGALAVVEEARLGHAGTVALFLLFVALAECVPIGLVVYAALAPSASDAMLARISTWLERNDQVVLIVAGLVFGVWFLVKALQGLGVL